jgi:hypothetical protein
MRVQTKGVDKNYSFPHMNYTQLMFAVIVPFSTLDTHACILLFRQRFFFYTFPIHATFIGSTYIVLTELSDMCRHSDSSG